MYQWLQRLFSGDTAASAPPEETAAPAPAAPMPAAAPAPAMPAPVAAPAATRPPVSFEQQDTVNRHYFGWMFNVEGEPALDTSALENQVLEALAAILSSQQSGSALVRRMPGLIPQLLQSLRSDNFSGAQLSRTISGDVVLVAAVIKLANSSFQGTGASINSVEHAVMLIGQEGLRHLITSVAFRPIIDMNSGYFTRTLAPRLWDHSERCASANRALAEALGVDPFEAFLAGLVQNVGLIVALRIMDQVGKGDRNFGSEMFCARLVRDARTLTCSIGREWSFPDSVTSAIREQAGVKRGETMSPLGRLLSLTDYLGKIRILVENARLSESEPGLFANLPAEAALGYQSLDSITDDTAEPDDKTP